MNARTDGFTVERSPNSQINNAVNLVTYNKESKVGGMINLTATETDFISQTLIPLFSNMVWLSKKELDFLDWVSIFKLKQLGLHHTEKGVGYDQRDN